MTEETPTTLETALEALLRRIIKEEIQATLSHNGNHEVYTLISAEEAAKRWEVPKSWIEEKARRGVLPSVKLGHYLRFRTIDLERFIKDHRK